ncbi:MAG: molecular chaperone TorD family protein [Bacteroidales bacterium]
MSDDTEIGQNSILKGYNLLLYFAGSMVMYEPVEECVTDFWGNGILATLPVNSQNPRFIEAASQLRCSCGEVTECTDLLKKDFRKLFKGPETPLVSPVRSTYKISGLAYNLEPEKVTEFYDAYGWRFRTRYRIPDDHIGIELLFLTLLIDKYIDFDDEACRKEMRMEIMRFIEHHILSWIPVWNRQMQLHASTLCYKGISTLIYACCEDIYRLLDSARSIAEIQAEFRN